MILLLGVCLPYIFYAAHLAEESVENRSDDWLPPHFQETQRLRWLESTFGGDEALMISYPGCSLDDQRLPAFAKRLVATEASGKPVFRRVITGSELLQELCGEPINLTREQAIKRLSGWVVGADGQTCAVAMISPQGKLDREGVVAEVRRAVAEVGLPVESLRMAGTTMENIAINETSTKWFVELSIASGLVCISLMYIAFRSVPLTLMVYGTAVISERLSLAWMHITNTPTDSVSTMTPALVYVLALSTGVHLANYYRDEIASGGLCSAPRRAARNGWKPCLLSTVTTALGLGSLLLSDLSPVQRFGGFAALGVSGMLCVQFLVLPFLWERFPPKAWAAKVRTTAQSDPFAHWWRKLAKFIESRHAAIAAVTAVIFIVGSFGVGRLEATARLHNLLPADAPLLQDYAWMESHIGPLVPLEVVLRFPADESSSLLERAQFVEEVRDVVETTPDIGNAICATTWLPPLPPVSGGMQSVIRRTVFNRRLADCKAALHESDLFRESESEQLWRIGASASASDPSLNYGHLMVHLKERVDPVLERHNADNGTHVTAVYTGSIPLMHKIQDQLLSDLVLSFLSALAMITIVMMLVMRSIPGGLLCMIPNILPTVIVFGGLGWLGPPIEVGAMMTAGAAIGIAVDDTLHFMTWFQRGLARGLNRIAAVDFAFHNCATAMLQTSLICGLGLLVFAFSPFVPIARFGWMLAALLGTAILGDLVLFPAILIGPFGAAFRPPNKTNDRPEWIAATVPDSTR